MNKIKVLYIHHATGWGGAPLSLFNMVAQLDKEMFDINVLLLKDSIVRDVFTGANIQCYVAKSPFYKYFYRFISYSEAGDYNWYNIRKLMRPAISWILSRLIFADRELKQFCVDIIHLNSSVLTDWLAPAKKKGKVVYHVREPIRRTSYDPLYWFMRYQVNKYADAVIAISEDNAKRIDIPHKTSIVYNYTSVSDQPMDKESYYSKKVLYAGGGSEIKGFYTLVDSLSFIDNSVQILFCGYYPSKNDLAVRKVIRRLKPRNRKDLRYLNKMSINYHTRLIGMVPDITPYIDECCCLVSPFSKTHFSRPIIEAHLRKKPVIATRIPGIDEQVRDGIDGVLVNINDACALADAINMLSGQPSLCKDMGENGYRYSIEKYSVNNIDKVKRVYQSLVYGKTF